MLGIFTVLFLPAMMRPVAWLLIHAGHASPGCWTCKPRLIACCALGKFQRSRGTPLKRLRSPESRMQPDSLLSPVRDRTIGDGCLDNMRTHKRFLSEVRHTSLYQSTLALSAAIHAYNTCRDTLPGCLRRIPCTTGIESHPASSFKVIQRLTLCTSGS